MEWENQLIQELQWSNKISNKASKELVAQEIAGLAKDGDVTRSRLRLYRLSHFVCISSTS